MSQAIINDALKNWVPYRLLVDNDATHCQWLNLKDKKITEPFFADTISITRENRSQRCISDLAVLPEWAASLPSVAPSAIVFHVSRCGSTLLSQVLSLNETNIVLSEVPFLDELLRLHYKQPGADLNVIDEQLKAAVRLYGQQRTGNELKEIETILQSEAILICNNNLAVAQKVILESLLFRIRSVKKAKNNKYVLLNAPNEKLETICQLLPGMKSPTILPLAESGWSSVHSVISEADFWNVIEQLKANGAEGILIIPIEKMVL